MWTRVRAQQHLPAHHEKTRSGEDARESAVLSPDFVPRTGPKVVAPNDQALRVSLGPPVGPVVPRQHSRRQRCAGVGVVRAPCRLEREGQHGPPTHVSRETAHLKPSPGRRAGKAGTTVASTAVTMLRLQGGTSHEQPASFRTVRYRDVNHPWHRPLCHRRHRNHHNHQATQHNPSGGFQFR